MAKFFVNAIVVHSSGNLKGVVENILEPDTDYARACVRWDDGTFSTHSEKELSWANTERPTLHKKFT